MEDKKYVVAATLLKEISGGLNIMTQIYKYKAKSKEEALGKFMYDVSTEFPEHNIHRRPVVVCVEDDKND